MEYKSRIPFLSKVLSSSNVYFLVLFCSLTFYSSYAQDLKSIQSDLLEIDSLLVYNHLVIAQQKADSLYTIVEKSTYEKEKTKLLLQRAKANLERNENSTALSLLLDVLSKAEKQNFYDLACEANIYVSLIHEINGDLYFAYNYLTKARKQCDKYKIDHLNSTILIRLASIHRVTEGSNSDENIQLQKLEQIGFVASLDSTMSLAKQAVLYAQKYKKYRDLCDAYFLIGTCHNYQGNTKRSIEYYLKEISIKRKINDFRGVLVTFSNVSKSYFKLNQPKNALVYIDSAFHYFDRVVSSDKYLTPSLKAQIYKELNEPDSAYYYANFALKELEKSDELERKTEIRKLEEQFQNDKKEETIRNKNQLIILISILVLVLLGAVISSNVKNRKINAQASIIEKQVSELHKSVEQKEILLSELQHRVKNNLQYVISLLEIQKESIGHSSMEDLIRNNQNRIHSIALLHKKLNVDESVDDVELNRYVNELSELVLESYNTGIKQVELSMNCEVETLPLSKALPIGLIIVELLSNSMKHAFKDQEKGHIQINISHDLHSLKNKLHYKDNGKGFDFEKVKTFGLGIEITKGLIDQLNADIETKEGKGLDLTIIFR
ncbi:sensor histidine kinase [Lacihabitans sp. LS3-19]|uniref:sensor histidine kinase n=1 Tax=Lacihabitans sp. LS3-19 TaxID=2487335 RepID=UPI0020CBC0AF|nr:sensor histidine kinase [Lacihabitans sp. LS3-19]MCP9767161.1 sensor histidine kinase [Lacihabitans sp. LS3-19]